MLRADKGKGKEVAPHWEDVPLMLVEILVLLFKDARAHEPVELTMSSS